MSESQTPPLVELKCSLLREYFFSRKDIAAFFGPWGNPHPTIPPTDFGALLAAHVVGENAPKAAVHHTSKRKGGHKVIKGWFRIGSYVPAPDNTTPWLCIDFDGGEDHADALADPTAAVMKSYRLFADQSLPAYLERSGGGKGWHLWLFFEPGIQAEKVRRLAQQLLPTDLPLANGGTADHRSNKGVEIFPKQDRLSRKGTGNLVWLPWWSDARGSGNQFFRVAEDDSLVAFVPESFDRVDESLLDQVLAATKREDPLPSKHTAKPKPPTSNDAQQNWQTWRRDTLAALRLEDVYGDLLTGEYSGEGWLECRDPSSNSGDQNPSAGVSDGTNSVERGSFHSFISGRTLSVFDYMVEQGLVADMKQAVKRIAELSGIPLPQTTALKQQPSSDQNLPEIQINQRQLRDIIDDAWQAIRNLNEQKGPGGRISPFLFRRGKFLVRLTRDEKEQPQIDSMDEAAVYGVLLRTADWVRVTQEGIINAAPPKDVARDMPAFPDKRLPVLDSVTTSPVYDADGRLILEPGYHAHERLWHQPGEDIHGLDVPANPSTEDIVAARSLLLDDLVVDFPFETASDRAHIIGAMLLPFVRRMIPGCTPIHLVEAPQNGSGKGLLCTLVSIVTTGSPITSRTLPTVEEEVRKMFTAELSLGRPIVLLDNADDKKQLHSPSLASVITSEIWTDRQLGRTAMLTLPNRAMWMLTGNNPKLSLELARRCIRIRINPLVDHAWKRQEFKHDEVVEWALENRVRLTRAVLILIQAWIAKGKPLTEFRLGSFERWSKIIGGILEVAGIPGFLETLDELYEASNEDENAWRDFIDAWWQACKNTPVKVSDLNDLCEREELLIALRGDKSLRSQQTRLGKALGRYRDRVFQDLRLIKQQLHGKHKGGVCFALQPVELQMNMGTFAENGDVVGTLQIHTSPGSNPMATGVPENDGDVGDVCLNPRACDRARAHAHTHAREERSGDNVPNVPTNGRTSHQNNGSGMGTSTPNVPNTSPQRPHPDQVDLANLPIDFSEDDSDLPF